ncbi:aldehyde dehydrogenase family protein [Pseudogracilibacillus sp. SO30301A]|uniref:aldehyde dehydrogenase family protein n=1 Tax=Pseudogracilibacillus sp. SO30301A TaxID=3098291 RepID=UPI00300E33E1
MKIETHDDSLITEIKITSRAQTKEAFEVANEAQKEWGNSTAEERLNVIKKVIEYFNENKEEIVKLISRETGGTVIKANVEFMLAMEVIEEALNYAERLDEVTEVPGDPEGKVNKIYHKPLGVISSIAPFNFPLNLSLRNIIPGIALGNAVVHKQGIEVGLVSGVVVAKAFEYAELPAAKKTAYLVFEVIERTIDADGQALLIPEITFDTYWTSLDIRADEVISLFHDHGTMEQFHSEIKTELDLERLPSGKFATNDLVLHLGLVAYNLLRIIGQESLQADDQPLRKKVQRRRIRTVIKSMITMASKMIFHAGRWVLKITKTNPWLPTFRRLYSTFSSTT